MYILNMFPLPFNQMLSILLFITFATLISASLNANDENWGIFKLTFAKEYRFPETENFRRAVWEKNVNYINQHNLEADMGIHTYWMGLNEYADLSDEEFAEIMTSFIPQNISSEISLTSDDNVRHLPHAVDWRYHGYVTRVKHQGNCGACWAFSATGALEGQYFKRYGRLVSFSEQNLVDCTNGFGNHGCLSGTAINSFKFIRVYGIQAEMSYPYHGRQGGCLYNRQKVVTVDRGFITVHRSEHALQTAVAYVGPISVAIDINSNTFRFYKRGVYKIYNCGHQLGHAVLVVGYGYEHRQDYWLVKNSWGAHWGEGGYIRMARNFNNMCGIASDASYPLV